MPPITGRGRNRAMSHVFIAQQSNRMILRVLPAKLLQVVKTKAF